jgi:hypothetical protein
MDDRYAILPQKLFYPIAILRAMSPPTRNTSMEDAGGSVRKGGWCCCSQENFCQKEQNLSMSGCSQNEEAKESARIQLPGTHGYSKGGGTVTESAYFGFILLF